jgi:UDP-GlcNAc3NAcA epimerase
LKKAIAIIGARPQFIKHFPFEKACEGEIDLVTIHTGQHYDTKMSAIFFDQLGMRKPKYILNAGGGNHGAQTGKMMQEIEEIVVAEQPDIVVVYGDTNSTLAGALVASKLHIPIAHIEAGLRSYNRQMPEEINRVLTDHISQWMFCPSELSVDNLRIEGLTKGVYVIGDLMKDLIDFTLKGNQLVQPDIDSDYYYVTLHRPYNTDEKDRLSQVLHALDSLTKKTIFAIHPRTRIAMERFGLKEADFSNVTFIDPQPYFENLGYIYSSSGLITDSGGMQKEAYWLNKKCATIRTETEWLETLEGGANTLMFEDLSSLCKVMEETAVFFQSDLYGDGQACRKIVEILK